jgi:hypothetical protein
MKKYSLFLVSVFSTIVAFGQNIIWEDEIIVTTNSAYGNVRPRLSVNPNGDPMIVMSNSLNGKVYFVKATGGVFSTPMPLLPGSLSSYAASWTGPDIASKGDTIIVVFKAQPIMNGRVYAVRSIDGGITFSDTIRVDGQMAGWMPSLDIDENGNPLVTYMSHDANHLNPKYVYVRSNDAGLTFEPESIITTGINGEACDCCPAEMISEGSKQILLYRNNEANLRDIYAVYSNDNGVTFPYFDNVDESNWVINSCPATGPAGVIVNNELFTTFMSAGTGTERVYVSRSSADSDLIFQEKFEIPLTGTGFQNFPRITNDDNAIFLTWTESVSNNVDIYTSWCPKNDLTQLATNVQIANTTNMGTQTNPEILIENNAIHLVYQNSGGGNLIYRKGQIGYLGNTEYAKENKFIYPNPSSSGEILNLPDTFLDSEVIWTDLKGKIVHTQFIDIQTDIYTPNLDKGIYFIKSTNYGKTYKINIQ